MCNKHLHTRVFVNRILVSNTNGTDGWLKNFEDQKETCFVVPNGELDCGRSNQGACVCKILMLELMMRGREACSSSRMSSHRSSKRTKARRARKTRSACARRARNGAETRLVECAVKSHRRGVGAPHGYSSRPSAVGRMARRIGAIGTFGGDPSDDEPWRAVKSADGPRLSSSPRPSKKRSSSPPKVRGLTPQR